MKELVIKIPERLWTKQLTADDYIDIVNAVANGTPLPEHHGRLIDGDKVLEDIVKKNPEWVSETGKRKRYARLVYYWAVKNAPTIIEGSDSE